MSPIVSFEPTAIGGIRIRIQSLSPAQLADAVHKAFIGKACYYSGEVALIDCSAISNWPTHVDWGGISSLFRRIGLQPVAALGVAAEQEAALMRHSLALITEESLSAPAAELTAQTEQYAPVTRVVNRPVRSGQQIYAAGGDLVLLAGVNPGGEVIADGHIHCWGRLAGRAVAGVRGDASARIFALAFAPEFVSVAGVYKTFEQEIPASLFNRPVQVRLDQTREKLFCELIELDKKDFEPL